MSDEELGAKPDAEIEPGEPNPGGVDAINEDTPFSGDEPEVMGRDLHPDRNPEAEEHVPDEITVPDDKQQEPDEESGSPETPEEPPA